MIYVFSKNILINVLKLQNEDFLYFALKFVINISFNNDKLINLRYPYPF